MMMFLNHWTPSFLMKLGNAFGRQNHLQGECIVLFYRCRQIRLSVAIKYIFIRLFSYCQWYTHLTHPMLFYNCTWVTIAFAPFTARDLFYDYTIIIPMCNCTSADLLQVLTKWKIWKIHAHKFLYKIRRTIFNFHIFFMSILWHWKFLTPVATYGHTPSFNYIFIIDHVKNR